MKIQMKVMAKLRLAGGMMLAAAAHAETWTTNSVVCQFRDIGRGFEIASVFKG